MVYCLDDEAKAFIELYKDKEAYKQRKDQIVSDTVKILTDQSKKREVQANKDSNLISSRI